MKDAAHDAKDAVTDAASTLKDKAGDAADVIKSKAGDAKDAIIGEYIMPPPSIVASSKMNQHLERII